MQDVLLSETSRKRKRRQLIQNTPGNSPSEKTLPRHIRPEESPISPTHESRETSTPETEQKIKNAPRAFVFIPNKPSPLQQKFLNQERPVVKTKAKDYNINFNGEELEEIIKKVQIIPQIEGAKDEDLAIQMEFRTTDPKVSDATERIPGYEEGD
ncbi:hypothetical protein O181_046862 [Austropuccinia psidii MF-1]|uniref:Uncharacterized protein n=1 Tax=Austropuccinia psidii MF-1 TaxID=1389203 RepID=A0A9Q3HK40_9BASI|nr:hypothetical protein [Austropuccinia psidii MF-1]